MTTFVRHDWTLFRNLNTISQRAGVPLRDLVPLVLKELMDNALDATKGAVAVRYGECQLGSLRGYWIQDDGDGISGDDAQIASLFSISRPLTSSKLLRLPTRGALGNGLRVVAGTVLASNGALRVETNGWRLELRPRDDGSTEIVSREPSSSAGTRIEIAFGDGLPQVSSSVAWKWAGLAQELRFTKLYDGRSNPHWYDSDSFHELLLAWQGPVDTLIDLFSESQGKAWIATSYMGVGGTERSRTSSTKLLEVLREQIKPLPPDKLGSITDDRSGAFARETGILRDVPGRGGLPAEIPYVIEAIAQPSEADTFVALVNGTPITGQLRCHRDGKSSLAVFGCGLSHAFPVVKRPFVMVISVIIPHMPITTDGKEPDFGRFLDPLQKVMTKSSRKLKVSERKSGREVSFTQAEIMEAHLQEAIAKTSGNGKYRFSMRQLFYALRPYVLEQAPEGRQNLSYNYYQTCIGEWEARRGEIKGMYRDPRGILYHPHTHETIPLGTIAVEQYQRPEWTFNKVLYIEKKGLFEVLKQARFPERYDVALLSSEGFATRAVRDLIDLLGEDGVEDIHVFCIHDADAPGTMIYQSLADATIARGARKVPVHNLGLEPWEAVSMGLQVESFPARANRIPVAEYIKDHAKDPDLEFDEGIEISGRVRYSDVNGYDWERWFQKNRVELNAMTSPQFLRWLEGKFEDLENRKVIPPRDVMSERLKKELESKTRAEITDRVLREAKLDDQVKNRLKVLYKEPEVTDFAKLGEYVRDSLTDDPSQHWSYPVIELAAEMAKR